MNDSLISRQVTIDTEGLEEEIRCEMCRNQMKTDRGCDGNCKYDEKLYEKIMQILDKRITPLTSAQPEITKGDLMKAIQAGIDAMQKNNVYECGMRNGMRWCKALLGEKLDFEDPLQYCKQEGEIDG